MSKASSSCTSFPNHAPHSKLILSLRQVWLQVSGRQAAPYIFTLPWGKRQGDDILQSIKGWQIVNFPKSNWLHRSAMQMKSMSTDNVPKLKPCVAINDLLTMIIPTDVTTLNSHEAASRDAFLSPFPAVIASNRSPDHCSLLTLQETICMNIRYQQQLYLSRTTQ